MKKRMLSLALACVLVLTSFNCLAVTALDELPYDERFRLVNATTDVDLHSNDLKNGAIICRNSQLGWCVSENSHVYIGIGDPNGILKDSKSVTYEYDILFDTSNWNDRVFLQYGNSSGWVDIRESGENANGFAAGGQLLPVPEIGQWGTISIVNDDYDPTQTQNGCITRLGFWVEGGTAFVSAIRAYDTEDPTKMIRLQFNKIVSKDDLYWAQMTAIPWDMSCYTPDSAAAYTAALDAIYALIAQETVTTREILDALDALYVAEVGLVLVSDPVFTHTHKYFNWWTYDETVHCHLCACGDMADVGEHDFRFSVIRPATETEWGYYREECVVCEFVTDGIGFPGDVNTDGVANTTDARLVLQYAAGIIDNHGLLYALSDVDCNGRVTTTDARYILQFAAGILEEFPANT